MENMMPAAKNTQSGFSLVEMLVAMVILAVGLLGLAQLQITAMKANSQSATSAAAIALAQQVVEEIAFMDADDAFFTHANGGIWPGGPFDVAGAGTYTIDFYVAEVLSDPSDATSDPISNLFKITIDVESESDVMHVLGKKKREFRTTTFKRTI